MCLKETLLNYHNLWRLSRNFEGHMDFVLFVLLFIRREGVIFVFSFLIILLNENDFVIKCFYEDEVTFSCGGF